ILVPEDHALTRTKRVLPPGAVPHLVVEGDSQVARVILNLGDPETHSFGRCLGAGQEQAGDSGDGEGHDETVAKHGGSPFWRSWRAETARTPGLWPCRIYGGGHPACPILDGRESCSIVSPHLLNCVLPPRANNHFRRTLPVASVFRPA